MRERFVFIFSGMMVGFFAGFLFAGSIKPPSAQTPAKMPAMVSDALESARKDRGNFEAQMKAAELYLQIQRYDDALSFLVRANQIQPDNFETMVSLGMVNLEGGHLDDSKKWFKLALKRQPNNSTILEGYAVLLLQQGNLEESRGVISHLEKLDPNNPFLPQLRSQLQKLKSSR